MSNVTTIPKAIQNVPDLNAKKAVLPDAEFNKTWDQEQNYKFVKKFNDPRFGEVSIVKNPANNSVLMVKEKMASSKNEASDDISNLKSRLNLTHPNMMRMVNYTTSVKKELCSTHYLTRAYYEFPKTDVQKEITDRKKALTDFNDRELTHMMYQSASGLQNLHSKNMVHGDIRPQLIGYDKAANHYQILDRFSDPTPLERCQTNNIVNNKDLYLAPQLYKKLKGADKKITYDSQKNDIYALGLSLLHAGTFDSMQDTYLPNGTINKSKLDGHLQELDNKYAAKNPILCQSIRRLVSEEESNRPDINQFLSSLPPYENFKQLENQNQIFAAPNAHVETAPVVEQRVEQVKEVPQPINYSYRNEAQPIQTYQSYEPSTITYTRPITQNIYAQPTSQYTYPQNTIVQPTSQYTYAQPTSQYTYSQPTAQYTYSQPSQYTTYNPTQQNDYTYVTERKVESIPNSTYVSTQDNTSIPSNMRYSHSYIDNNRSQQPVERIVRYSRNVPTEYQNISYSNVQYTPTEKVIETRVVREAPNYKVNNANEVTEFVSQQKPVTEIRKEVISEQKVEVQAPEYKTESRVFTVGPDYKPESRFVKSIYPTQYSNNSTNYVTEQRKSIRFLNADQVQRNLNGQTVERIEYKTAENYITPTYSSVDIRKEAYTTPINTNERVIRKRYIRREDGTVVEIDADAEVNLDDIRKRLQAN